VTSTILMISKPIAPPWNDSSKNLVRDLATAGHHFEYQVLTPRHYRLDASGVESDPVYSPAGSAFTPPLVQNLRVLRRLLRRDRSAVTHFFYAPNPKTSTAARLALLLRPRRTVQTVCSAPRSFSRSAPLLFADRVVVLSRDTRRRFEAAGVAPERLVVIPPGIRLPDLPVEDARAAARSRFGLPRHRPVIIYPGDYQFSDAAWTFARAVLQLRDLDATFVFACRIKQPASLEVERRVRALLADGGALQRVLMLREVDDMQALLTACDLCALPAESLYAKMDLPLVVIEAMALGVPPLLADRAPLSELAHPGAAVTVPPQDPDALAAAIRELVGTDRLRSLGEAARRAAREHYGIETVSRRHEDLYQQMIGR
jgi:glycosyltransferase involved in cell wall biosynthesis